MRPRSEEEPDEEPFEPETEPESPQVTAPVPTVGFGTREYEYRTEGIDGEALGDGRTLAERLTSASADGWDYVDTIPTGTSALILYRRPKRPAREVRRVGFAPPARA